VSSTTMPSVIQSTKQNSSEHCPHTALSCTLTGDVFLFTFSSNDAAIAITVSTLLQNYTVLW